MTIDNPHTSTIAVIYRRIIRKEMDCVTLARLLDENEIYEGAWLDVSTSTPSRPAEEIT